MAQDSGVPIWEAVERWTPKELWQRYREVAGHDSDLYLDFRNPLQSEARRLRSRISEILVDRLRKGELVASALALPLKPTSRRSDIAPELWSRLSFSGQFQMVVGNGLRFTEVLIREARPTGEEPGPPERHGVRQEPRPEPRRPGRPSVMAAIEAQLRRRAEAGQIEASMRLEAEVLASWAQRRFPNVHVPASGSIERKLGRVYRELKTTKSSDKSADKL